MAHIIAVVGAGGKTSLMERLAHEYSAGKYRVAITTTTQIIAGKDSKLVTYYGKDIGNGKLGYPGSGSFQKICLENQYVLVEADGARHHPVKIPNDSEPVIPEACERIIVVMSSFALGRAFSEICQRSFLADMELFREAFGRFDKNTRLTKAHIDFIADTYYIKPLQKRFPKAKVEYYYNEPGRDVPVNPLKIKKIGMVLMASGMSKRFGSNKLLYELNGKELFRWGLDALLETKARLKSSDKRLLNVPETDERRLLTESALREIESEVIVVSRFPEILEHPEYRGRVVMTQNAAYAEGISASVRIGCVEAIRLGCDAVLYLVADEPYFTSGNLINMIREYLVFGKRLACAYSDHEANPAIFHLDAREELLKLKGDTGPIGIIRANPLDTYYYIVKNEKLFDIDVEEDLLSF
ncbi:MAG: putative selenium-dependent hydroxylase accessory protein YqeC [Lachnospiraceae bacterium]|nr:putative selenium-dependent hydroxylase accessory protein YqeC [Lachnospiraceae bacterium]